MALRPGGVLALAAYLFWVALRQLHCDLSAPSQCQTTYIWQDYMPVNLSREVAALYPSYRLITYVGDNQAEAGRHKATIPVLFVHGHLGTHQQMRSMASETARELLRRAKAEPWLSYWLTWQATDFGEEMSALNAWLLARQAEYVVACIKHLQAAHSTVGSRSPFRMAVVGYSMGGIVARAALKRLEGDSAFDVSSVTLLLTLGAPNRHFPSFMPPAALQSITPRPHLPPPARCSPTGSLRRAPLAGSMPCAPDTREAGTTASAAGAGAGEDCNTGCAVRAMLAAGGRAAAAAGWVPTVAITAGPGDLMVSELFSGAPLEAAGAPAGSWVQLSMQDMPGVWTTSNHKSIVSCNQLVRHLAPLLADVAELSLRAAGDLKLKQQQLESGSPESLEGAHAAGAGGSGPAATARRHHSDCSECQSPAAGSTGPCSHAAIQWGPEEEPRGAGQPDVRAEILELVRQRMSTSVVHALSGHAGLHPLGGHGGACSAMGGGRDGTAAPQSAARGAQPQPAGPGQQAGAGAGEAPSWVYREVEPGQTLSLWWDAARHRSLGRAGLLLIVNQAKPCQGFSLRAAPVADTRGGGRVPEGSGSEGLELAGAAQPLPSLVPGVLEDAGGPGRARPWPEIMAGIDWLGNATWLLYAPLPAAPDGARLELLITAPAEHTASVLAQVLMSPPLAHAFPLPAPSSPPLQIPAGSPAVSHWHPPVHWLFPPGSSSSGGGGGRQESSRVPARVAHAADTLFGSSPPWRLRVVSVSSCHGNASRSSAVIGGQQACLLPAIAALGTGQGQQQAPETDIMRVGSHGVPLWRQGIVGRSLVVVADPRCCHTLSVEWDVAGWLGVSLRHHAYSLPSLCIAHSMAAALTHQHGASSGGGGGGSRPCLGVPGTSSAALLAATALLAGAWGSQHPRLMQRATGVAPWTSISAVEGAALWAVAHGMLTLVRGAVRLPLRLVGLAAGRVCQGRGSRFPATAGTAALAFWAAAVVGAAAVHPALALLAGLLRLWLSMAAVVAQRSRGRGANSAAPRKCAAAHAVVPPSDTAPDPVTATTSAAQPAMTTSHQRGRQPPGDRPTAGLRRSRPAPNCAGDGSVTHPQTLSSLLASSHGESSCPSRGASVGQRAAVWESAAEWLTLYFLVALLAAPSFVAWVHSGHRTGLRGGLAQEGAPLLLMGLHACWVAREVGAPGERAAASNAGLRVALLASGRAAAVVAGVGGLWGYPYMSVYASALAAALPLCQGACQAASWGASHAGLPWRL